MSNLKRNLTGSVVVGVLVLLTMPGAWAQTSAITGTVTDVTQAVLPGVDVEITNVETGVTRSLVSNDVGRFTARSLNPGIYRVSATIAGFKTAVRTDVHVTIDQEFVVNLTLEIGEVTEEVTVMGGAELVQTTSATMQSLVDEVKIRELPLNGRDYLQLATLQPGAVQMRGQIKSTSPQTGSGLSLSISGGRPFSNLFKLDGITINDQGGMSPGSIFGANLGVEAIREFSILTNTYSTEYGRGSGGVISSVLRSGTNDIHGSLWYFHRNAQLDARNFFDNAINPGDTVAGVPHFRRHQYGAAVGGAIVQDKTFIFGSYEALRQFREESDASNVPSAAAKRGELVSGTFPVDPGVAFYLNAYPAGTSPTSNPDFDTFFSAPGKDTSADFFTLRLDHQINDNNSLNASYLIEDATVLGRDTFDLSNDLSTSRRQMISGQWTSLISPTVINTFRMGYSRPNGATGVFTDSDIPEFREPSPEFSFIPGRPSGIVRVGGIAEWLTGTGSPDLEGLLMQSTQFYEDVSWLTGNHDLKMGFSVDFLRPRVDATNRENGQFRFGNLEDFILNRANQFRAQFPGSDTRRFFRQSLWGGYIQDKWRISSNFVLNLGLRYEISTQVSELEGEESRIVNQHRASPGSVPGDGLILGDGYFGDLPHFGWGNIAPRIGFAWDVSGNGKTAIRGGFGIFGDMILATFLNLPALRMPPFFLRGSFNQPAVGGELEGTFPNEGFNAFLDTQGGLALGLDPIQNNPPQPYRMQFNLNIQHEIAQNSVVTVGYVGGLGRNFMHVVRDSNVAANDETRDGRLFFPVGGERRNPNFERIGPRFFNANNSYHSLQLGANRRFTEGFRAQASYTWSKSMDDSSSTFSTSHFENSIESPWIWDTKFNRAVSAYDVRQAFVLNGTWDLPLGEGAFLDGWQIAGIYRALSGVPLTPIQDGDRAGTATDAPDNGTRPDLAPGGDTGANPSGGDKTVIFDTGAFVPSAILCSGGTLGTAEETTNGTCEGSFGAGASKIGGFMGNVGRNTIIGDGLSQFDLSIIKRTPLTAFSEDAAIEFRAEFFNILNSAEFENPDEDTRIVFDDEGALVGVPGVATKTNINSREIQLALKILF